MKNAIALVMVVLLLAPFAAFAENATKATSKPNIVFILIDDK